MFTKIVDTPVKYLIPCIIAISIFGVYAVQVNTFDFFLLIGFRSAGISVRPPRLSPGTGGAGSGVGPHDRKQYAPGLDRLQRRLADLPAKTDLPHLSDRIHIAAGGPLPPEYAQVETERDGSSVKENQSPNKHPDPVHRAGMWIVQGNSGLRFPHWFRRT